MKQQCDCGHTVKQHAAHGGGCSECRCDNFTQGDKGKQLARQVRETFDRELAKALRESSRGTPA